MAEPIRTCLGCRRRRGRGELTRLVARDGAVRVDPRRDQPGRGAWVCPDPDCAERVVGDGGRRLRRALRADGATVTLEPTALRASIVTRAGGAGDGAPAAAPGDSRRQAAAARSHDPQPSRSDASRGVPT